MIAALVCGAVRSQDSAPGSGALDRALAALPARELPRLLAELVARKGDQAVTFAALAELGVAAHPVLLGVLREPPSGPALQGFERAFGQLGANAAVLEPVLLEAKHSRFGMRADAELLLARLEQERAARVPVPVVLPDAPADALLAQIRSGPHRWAALRVLMHQGDAAVLPAVAALQALACGTDAEVAAEAESLLLVVRYDALGRALLTEAAFDDLPEPARSRELVTAALARPMGLEGFFRSTRADSDARVRAAGALAAGESAMVFFGRTGPDAKSLERLAEDRDPLVRTCAKAARQRLESRLTAYDKEAVRELLSRPRADVEFAKLPEGMRPGEHEATRTRLESLARHGAAALSALPEALAALGSSDRLVRRAARQTVLAIGAPALAQVEKLASSEAPIARRQARLLLAVLGPPSRERALDLAEQLSVSLESERDEARDAYSEVDPRPLVPFLADLLADPEHTGRTLAALDVLGGWPVWNEAIPQLVPAFERVIESSLPGPRQSAIAMLGRSGPRGAAVLVRLLARPEGTVRRAALAALRVDAKLPQDAFETLLNGIAGADEEFAVACASRIGAAGRELPRVTAAILARLATVGARMRGSLCHALIRLEAVDATVVPALEALAARDFDSALAMALLALRPGHERALAEFRRLFASANVEDRKQACMHLAGAGANAAPLIEALTPLLNDPEKEVVEAALWCLRRLGATARPALPAIRRVAASGAAGLAEIADFTAAIVEKGAQR